MQAIEKAFGLVATPGVLISVLLASAFGMVIGAIPGLTATMAIALLVPITFFMDPLPAVGAMIACSAMAIFAGDIPSTLLRIPGTPASAAYTDEAYAMTRKGEAETALGANLLFSAIGGLFGTAVLIVAAPALAEVALRFSSFEYFWLAVLGLTCAIFIGAVSPLKGLISLFIGLLVATVGLNNPAGVPRFTFGYTELMGGIDFIPAMIGLFAVSEVLRAMVHGATDLKVTQSRVGNLFRNWGGMIKTYWRQQVRGNTLGTAIGILPGAGADIAAWVAYAMSKKFSKTPEKFGKGHVEGIVESTSANNAALGGAWVPALVFGIPGDSITAVVIGVLFIKGLNPGPTLFINNPESIYAVFLIFILANLFMIPLGWAVMKGATVILRVPRRVLMPLILGFSMVGAFAVNNTAYGIVIMLAFGVLGFLMEENDIPVAPCILGIVLGPMIEENFVTSMIKSDGSFLAFFERPIAGALGVFTILVVLSPLIGMALRRMRRPAANAA
ncbi:TctA family transporter [Chelatococcus sambhunathii]|uniref:C4-dicarboxylate ABC transporter permease n=2 Tax=Chelatococcus TaxID=28209 RepID=A0AAC9JNB2_9HYPH|nr:MULTISPECIES: tripartite tricarboxylate transporter permease [Chelatococcus]APF36987.1 C4-dicarboxylate ABC transporter permease [Chelatococcus daeguensis]CUA88059.1 TctA family transporter [Chelatococcus sambhunathii]